MKQNEFDKKIHEKLKNFEVKPRSFFFNTIHEKLNSIDGESSNDVESIPITKLLTSFYPTRKKVLVAASAIIIFSLLITNMYYVIKLEENKVNAVGYYQATKIEKFTKQAKKPRNNLVLIDTVKDLKTNLEQKVESVSKSEEVAELVSVNSIANNSKIELKPKSIDNENKALLLEDSVRNKVQINVQNLYSAVFNKTEIDVKQLNEEMSIEEEEESTYFFEAVEEKDNNSLEIIEVKQDHSPVVRFKSKRS